MSAILVPVDGSIHALKALSIACDLAEKFGGRVAILHVLARDRQADRLLDLPVAKAFPPELASRLKLAAAGRRGALPDDMLTAVGASILNDAEGRVRRRGHEAERLPVADGDPADAIIAAAGRIGASTIVMGCRGLSDTEAESFGSVSNKVFQKADCTCISVK